MTALPASPSVWQPTRWPQQALLGAIWVYQHTLESGATAVVPLRAVVLALRRDRHRPSRGPHRLLAGHPPPGALPTLGRARL